MNNLQNNISIASLLYDGNTTAALKLIDMGISNLDEKTFNGNNLLSLSVFLGHFDVADKLISLNTKDHTQFIFELNDNSKTFFEFMMYDADTFNKYYSFLKSKKINLKYNFLDIIDSIAFNKSDIFNDLGNVKKLKSFLNNSVDNIKELEPFDTIQKITKTNCPHLLQLYYDICEFDKLPLQKHPAFKLLRDVATNPTKYYDYHVFSNNADMQNEEYNINKSSIKKIDRCFKKITDSQQFYEYFKKNEAFLFDISQIQQEGHCHEKILSLRYKKDIYSPQIEVNHIYKATEELNNNCSIKNHDKFLNHYLTHWPTYYFKNKINHCYNNDDYEKYKSTFEKFTFDSLFISKDSEANKIISSISDAAKEIKENFNLQYKSIGRNLNLWFMPTKNGSGYHQAISNKIVISNDMNLYDTTSAIVHEYTHNMQSYADDKTLYSKIKEEIINLRELSKEWIDYPVKDFSQFLGCYLMTKIPDRIINKEEFALIIEKAITCSPNNIDNTLTFLKNNSKSFFSNALDHHLFTNYFLEDPYTQDLIGLYYSTQKNKDYSYEYHLWKKHDDAIKASPASSHLTSDTITEYWMRPEEIHARLNQALHEEKTSNSYTTINPLKLESMKKAIAECNTNLSNLFKEKISKKDTLDNIKNLKGKNKNPSQYTKTI